MLTFRYSLHFVASDEKRNVCIATLTICMKGRTLRASFNEYNCDDDSNVLFVEMIWVSTRKGREIALLVVHPILKIEISISSVITKIHFRANLSIFT